MNKYFCIFGGGGIRGAAYSGAVRAFDELGINITGWAGSSIGAVVAGLISFKYTPAEIKEIFDNVNFEFFKDLNFNFGKDFAISKGNIFYDWMKNKIEAKFYPDYDENKEYPPVTFKELEKELVIFTVDLTTSKLYEFSKTKTPDAEIAHAIRVSVAMPGLYSPVFNEDECLVDGDLLKSMPLWKASDTISKLEDRILAFRLESNETKKKITNTVEYLNAVYDSVSGIASDFVINTYKNCDKYDYIKINLENVSVVDFMIGKEKKKEMSDIGYMTTMNYFKKVYPLKKEKLFLIYKKIFSAFQKITYLIKNNDIENAKFEISDIIASIIDEKEILDKKLVKEIQSFRETFNENVMITGGIFKTRYKLINKDSLILTSRNINEAAFKKINEFNNV